MFSFHKAIIPFLQAISNILLKEVSKAGGTDSHDGCVLTHRGMDLLEDTV
ncbi:hypothetical protein STRDD11_01087 [Streptococcus sp. DD11]|nr:hypothetical protein STRDD11_01087 [Streptococcus sp. DD11]